jgi:hypothetical protein
VRSIASAFSGTRLTGIAALGSKPRSSWPPGGYRIFSDLLGGMTIDRPNQVLAVDVTYIPDGRGSSTRRPSRPSWTDWASRTVLSRRLSNTMGVPFCAAALGEALLRFGKPQIFNTDRGSQFASMTFTGPLEWAGIQISVDGRGARTRCAPRRGVDMLSMSCRMHQGASDRTPVWLMVALRHPLPAFARNAGKHRGKTGDCPKRTANLTERTCAHI